MLSFWAYDPSSQRKGCSLDEHTTIFSPNRTLASSELLKAVGRLDGLSFRFADYLAGAPLYRSSAVACHCHPDELTRDGADPAHAAHRPLRRGLGRPPATSPPAHPR